MAQRYGWIITKDCLPPLDGEKSIVGTNGPRGNQLALAAFEKCDKAQKFRLKDGDGEVYCEGLFIDLTQTCSGFEPLEDYGYNALGATTIEYFENGRWVAL